MDEPLLDSCLVVRGGIMDLASLRLALATCFQRRGFYGLSVWGENGMDIEEICANARLPNARIRVSTVGRLRELGFEPRRAGRRPHLTIHFSEHPDIEELQRLSAAFGRELPNPRQGP